MPTVTLAVPIPGDQLESWRRFMQELGLSRRKEFEVSRKLLGVWAESVWLLDGTAVWKLEASDPEGVVLRLSASNSVFDRWFARQVRECCGFELIELLVQARAETVLEFQESPTRE